MLRAALRLALSLFGISADKNPSHVCSLGYGHKKAADETGLAMLDFKLIFVRTQVRVLFIPAMMVDE